MPERMATANRNLESRSHSFVGTSANRDDWRRGLDVPLFEPGQTEYLLWIGCSVAFEERAQQVARAMVKILDAPGVSWGILEESRCTLDPAQTMGNEFLFVELAQANIEKFQELEVGKVITMCAHCFNSFHRYYPELGASWQTIPHSVPIDRLIREDTLAVKRDSTQKITFHDPCYLARRGCGARRVGGDSAQPRQDQRRPCRRGPRYRRGRDRDLLPILPADAEFGHREAHAAAQGLRPRGARRGGVARGRVRVRGAGRGCRRHGGGLRRGGAAKYRFRGRKHGTEPPGHVYLREARPHPACRSASMAPPVSVVKHPPMLGAHTRELLSSLSHRDADVDALIVGGVAADRPEVRRRREEKARKAKAKPSCRRRLERGVRAGALLHRSIPVWGRCRAGPI